MTKPTPSLFQRIKRGLEEGIQFAKGEITLRTVEAPAPPPALKAREVLRLRRQCGMSQQVFARTLNVSVKTVQSWEQGRRRPSQAALRLLQLLRTQPDLVCASIS